ncbi:hypothetical protein ACJJTC_011148 [Scirpophaga incertulas]
MNNFCRNMPKIELHAHLNGSISQPTMLKLMRYYADSGIEDKSNAFINEFQIGAGDSRILSIIDCFQFVTIAQSLTRFPEALKLATLLTLQEFHEEGCIYIELRSTPRNTQYMTMKQYIETIIEAIRESSLQITLVSKYIISIDRRSAISEAEKIINLAIDSHKQHQDVVVGVELSGDPTVGKFSDFLPAFSRAREAGLKVTLHCGEICNVEEILEMIEFNPDRIGHGTCIHPDYGGTAETWSALCESKIPVEVCLTSNIKTKSSPDYSSHHFKKLYEANIPVIICTDDKGVFITSLSQEHQICADTFNLDESEMVKITLQACNFVFAEGLKDTLQKRINDVMCKN